MTPIEGPGKYVIDAMRPCRLAGGALDELDAYLTMLREALERNYDGLDRLLAKRAEER